MESAREGNVQAVESWLVVLETLGKMWWEWMLLMTGATDSTPSCDKPAAAGFLAKIQSNTNPAGTAPTKRLAV